MCTHTDQSGICNTHCCIAATATCSPEFILTRWSPSVFFFFFFFASNKHNNNENKLQHIVVVAIMHINAVVRNIAQQLYKPQQLYVDSMPLRFLMPNKVQMQYMHCMKINNYDWTIKLLLKYWIIILNYKNWNFFLQHSKLFVKENTGRTCK